MSDLLSKLGLDGKLLLAQVANFLVLLFLLRKFAYGPLLRIMKERRTKIEEGLRKAEEADHRLLGANETVKGRIREAEAKGMEIVKATEDKARKLELELLAEAHKKEAAVLLGAERTAKAKEAEAGRALQKEAAGLIRQAISKAVAISPEAVDEALVRSAVRQMKTTK